MRLNPFNSLVIFGAIHKIPRCQTDRIDVSCSTHFGVKCILTSSVPLFERKTEKSHFPNWKLAHCVTCQELSCGGLGVSPRNTYMEECIIFSQKKKKRLILTFWFCGSGSLTFSHTTYSVFISLGCKNSHFSY